MPFLSPRVLAQALATAGLLAGALPACSGATDGAEGFPEGTVGFSLTTTSEECGVCHPVHYEEWRGSMHAYATKDPVFRAVNQIFLEDTGGEGESGQFCIGCHAPVASRLGMTPVEGAGGDSPTMAMPDDPAFNDGVQCVSCHAVASVEAAHNAQFTLADSAYAGVTPTDAATAAHPIEANPILRDGTLCGTCHDVVNEYGVAVEATYSEWFERYEGRTLYDLNCNSCHMQTYTGPMVEGGEDVEVHRHTFVGVDQALSGPFPNKEAQAEAVGKMLKNAASLKIDDIGTAGDLRGFRVTVTNNGTGHALPSGTSAERRVWVHLVATDGVGNVVHESGGVDEHGDVKDHGPAEDRDKDLLKFGQSLLGPDDTVVPFSWQATKAVRFLLEPGESRHGEYEVDVAGAAGDTLEVTVTLRYRAFQWHFIEELIHSGHLAEGAVAPSPIYDIATLTKSFPMR